MKCVDPRRRKRYSECRDKLVNHPADRVSPWQPDSLPQPLSRRHTHFIIDRHMNRFNA